MKWQIFNVPKYHEICVQFIWEMMKEWENLMKYSPDLDPPKLPERWFILDILWIMRKAKIRELIKIEHFNWSIKIKKTEDDLVEITSKAKVEILRLLSKKNIFLIFNYNFRSNSRENSISIQAGSEATTHEYRTEEISSWFPYFKALKFRQRWERFWFNNF